MKEHQDRKIGLVDQAVDLLRTHIISGQWAVGSRIPTEPELAALLGVGRNTVREAVQSLVHAGLLDRQQGSGTYVTAKSELGTVISRQLADAHQRDILEVRLALEVSTARLAAHRRTDKDIAELRELHNQRLRAITDRDLARMTECDLELHRYIARCSRNSVLAELYETLLDNLSENISFNFQNYGDGTDSHEGLVNAISSGDQTAAEDEVRHYFTQITSHLPKNK